MNKFVNGKLIKITDAEIEKMHLLFDKRTKKNSSEARIKELEAEIKALKEQIIKE